MSQVEIRGLRKSFGAFEAIGGVDLSVEKGEFCALLGPSGGGKSTLLRLIAGLEETTSGEIRIGGKGVTDLDSSKRQIAMVFQSYALYPHMNVADNNAFSLEVQGLKKAERRARAAEIARLLHLEELLERKPAARSGGQRQRVAIGRALVRDPAVFLFDEPLSNLDGLLRVQMRIELANLHREFGAMMIYVTHDQVDAMTMADRIVALDGGAVQQVGSPLDLFDRPANRFVAGFIGSPSMSFLEVEVGLAENGRQTVNLLDTKLNVPMRSKRTLPAGSKAILGIRPEHLSLTSAEGADLLGHVELVERLGNQTYVQVNIGATNVTVQMPPHTPISTDETVGLKIDADRVYLFGPDGLVC